MRVNRQIVGFKKIKFYTHGKRRRREALHARAGNAHHRVLAALPRRSLKPRLPYTPIERQNGITGLGNALRTVASLLLMCDPRDLGLSATATAVFLYDAYPGGIGQSAPLYRMHASWCAAPPNSSPVAPANKAAQRASVPSVKLARKEKKSPERCWGYSPPN